MTYSWLGMTLFHAKCCSMSESDSRNSNLFTIFYTRYIRFPRINQYLDWLTAGAYHAGDSSPVPGVSDFRLLRLFGLYLNSPSDQVLSLTYFF